MHKTFDNSGNAQTERAKWLLEGWNDPYSPKHAGVACGKEGRVFRDHFATFFDELNAYGLVELIISDNCGFN